MDWRTTQRANLHVADKAECWIPQGESSRNYHGSVQEQVCLETGLKSKQKSCTKGLLAARGQLGPLSGFSPLGVFWEQLQAQETGVSQNSASPICPCIWSCQLTLAGKAHIVLMSFHPPLRSSKLQAARVQMTKVTMCWQKTMDINPCLSKVHMQTHKHNIKRKI